MASSYRAALILASLLSLRELPEKKTHTRKKQNKSLLTSPCPRFVSCSNITLLTWSLAKGRRLRLISLSWLNCRFLSSCFVGVDLFCCDFGVLPGEACSLSLGGDLLDSFSPLDSGLSRSNCCFSPPRISRSDPALELWFISPGCDSMESLISCSICWLSSGFGPG